MKKIVNVAIAIFLIVGINACKKDDDLDVQLAKIKVILTASPEFVNVASVQNVAVYLTNTGDNTKSAVFTDVDGVATFANVAPGNYNISSQVTLTAEEAGPITGVYEELTLNATKTGVNLVSGSDISEEIVLDGKASGDLVIKEFYYNGANDPTWATLFKDQFVEIYNNSDKVIFADGLYLANLAPGTYGTDASDIPLGLPMDEFVYADKILQIPGNGQDNPIQPGESVVIALNAVDYSDGGVNDYTVDLSNATFETYAISWLESLGRTGSQFFDLDNVDVPNMTNIYLNIENNGWFNFNTTGSSIAIFRNDNFTVETVIDPRVAQPGYENNLVKIKVDDIIDGIDMMVNSSTAAFKRLPTSIDAGFNFVSANSYTSESVRRKVAKEVNGRKVLMDSNNSSNDFEVIPHATPGTF